MDTFKYPTNLYDYDAPHFLFYSQKTDIVIGRCIWVDYDESEQYRFEYGEYTMQPTHWMPLPKAPGVP